MNTPAGKKRKGATETHHHQTDVPFQKTITISDSKHMHNNLNFHVLQQLTHAPEEFKTEEYNRETEKERQRREERGGMERFVLSTETS